MKFYLSKSSEKLTQKNKRKHIWYKIVSAMAAIVVFCTTYALILPAITISEEYYCGLEEHQHSDACYNGNSSKVNCCTAVPHQHDESCYDAYENLICGLADYFIHTHSEICYDDNNTLVCTIPENKAHEHTEDCYIGELAYSCGMKENEVHQHVEDCYYQTDTLICEIEEHDAHQHDENCYEYKDVLICEQEESETHTHEDTCYTQEKSLLCEIAESEGHLHSETCYVKEKKIQCTLTEGEPHQHGEECSVVSKPTLACGLQEVICEAHTEACYDSDGKLVCGKLEAEEHIHTEECFDVQEVTDPVLICGLEEHVHEVQCTSDKDADVETAEIWRKTVPDSETLTGILAEDLLAVAKSQIGYQESSRNFEVDENGERKGYTRYGKWYGDSYGDWDAMYVSFCLYYAAITEEVFPYESDGALWIEELESMELYRLAGEYQPVAGDVIFFGPEEEIRVGIIAEISEEELIVIEGNSENSVKSNTYAWNEVSGSILGYGSLDAAYQRGVELGLLEEIVQEPVEDSSEDSTEDNAGESVETEDEIQLHADYGEIHVILRAPKDAFPASVGNLELVVSEPDETMKENIRESMGEEHTYFAVDIKILCDGEEIQPSAKVEVLFEMESNPFAEEEAVEAYHVVDDTESENLQMQEVVSERNDDGDIMIETNHFSTYVVTAAEESEESSIALYAVMPNTWEEALTDRSSYIGVESEGYTDSPYTQTRQFKGTNITALSSTGGTVYVGGDSTLQYAYYAETFWDGTKPVRITTKDSGEQNRLIKSVYSDWILEDGSAPYGALKIDNVELKLNSAIESQKFELYGRGNKIVIGENVNTDHIMANSPGYIYGGSRTNDSTTSGYPTNVVVTSGRWGLVIGGGGADVNDGTQVTIRDTAEVGIIYGGGIDDGDVDKGSSENATNVYIEGGKVTEVYGGNQTTSRGIKVNGDINIDVSGGQVGTIHAGNDHRGIEGTDELEGSKVRGGAVVNIYNTGSVTNLIGDYMHYDSAYGDQLITLKSANGNYTMKGRHIRNLMELNVHSDNNFGMMDYWDIIRINNLNEGASPNSVTVSSTQDLVGVGNATANIGSMYIGRMEVTNGGKFYLKNNCFINYMNEVSTSSDEGVTSFDLNHAWMGESTEERRAWSTLAIEGSCIQPSTADTNLFTLSNPCDDGRAGMRIKGNVEGFSVLEACGTPMYSTGDTYYYYVVADSSDNGGKAFKEPEGADYVVCYRYLDDGRIGWYLRERPVLTMSNSLVRVGTEGTLTPTDNGFYTGCPSNYVIMHVDMKGFAYEWSSNPDKNRVDFNWTIFDGYESATSTTGGISIQTMADIENNIYSTSNPNGIFANVEYNATGTDEGSTEQTERVSSFYVIIDTSEAINPRYYEVDSNFHYTRGEDDYDDLRVGQTVDAARCTYDFAKTGEELGDDGYANSVMTTYKYEDDVPPKGADDALLRVYLPEGVTANTLTVKESDGNFTFEETGKSASLVTNSQVAQYYSTEEESTYNHQFAVTLQQDGDLKVDLAGGASLSNLSGKESYHCAVYSYEKIDYTDITPESDLGLQLQLQLNTLTKDGNAVGTGDPSATNDGELRIQVLPVGTVIKTTKITIKKDVLGAEEGDTTEFDFQLSYLKTDDDGEKVTHTERFTLSHGEEQTFIVPLETEITITETGHEGYFVQYQIGNGELTDGYEVLVQTPGIDALTEDEIVITFYNSIGTEMPSTGDIGTKNHTLLGVILVMGAMVLFWMRRRGRRVA